MTTLHTTQKDADHLASKTAAAGHSVMDRIEAAVPELPEVKEKLSGMVSDGKARVTDWREGIEDGIGKRPIQSLLIAAAVGAFIGALLGRRSH